MTDEKSWVIQAQQGNDEAFTQLVETYQKPVYNLCYRMLGEPESAEDAAQETFLRAYQNLHRYDASRSFGTWILSIGAHYCIDLLRKKKFTMFSMDAETDDGATFELPDASAPDPEIASVKREQRDRLHLLLKDLDATDRAAVIMRYWYDFSEVEIAKSLNLTVSAVKSRLHRSRRALAGMWQDTLIALRPDEPRAVRPRAGCIPGRRHRAQAPSHGRGGPEHDLGVEDRLTIQYQVQEMLRIERIFEPAGIQEELAASNPLIPDGGNWKATMMIEYPDPRERAAALAQLRGVEDRCYVEASGCSRVMAIADEDLARENAEKTSAVHWLRFELPAALQVAVRAGAPVTVGVDHPAYRHRAELPAATVQSLLRDLG